jgi:cysteine-rich repeat protein
VNIKLNSPDGWVIIKDPSANLIKVGIGQPYPYPDYYSNAQSAAGTYSIDSVFTPTGYKLKSVEDLYGNPLGAPYFEQTLTSGGSISFIVNYETLCGNGSVDAGETCDDGNLVSGDGCDQFCKTEVAQAGTLSIYSAVNPAGGDVTAGSPMVLVSKYRFHAFNEPFKISQLTIANDVEGIINAPVNADAVLGVAIKYKDINGTSQYIPYDPARPEIKYIPLNNGKAELIDLDIPVPKDLDAYLEIYAFIDSMANNPTIAGKTFRIGLMEPSISSFKAVGEGSTANPPSPVIEYTPADGSSVKTFTVVGPTQP